MSNQAEITVVISNLDIMKASQGETGQIGFIMDKLRTAGVPVDGWFQAKGFTVSTGKLRYRRNAMNMSSEYLWQSDEYIKERKNV